MNRCLIHMGIINVYTRPQLSSGFQNGAQEETRYISDPLLYNIISKFDSLKRDRQRERERDGGRVEERE
jgi:hypothetical protein